MVTPKQTIGCWSRAGCWSRDAGPGAEEGSHFRGVVAPQVVPQTIYGNCVAVDDPPDQLAKAAMDGPFCRKWSPDRKPAHGGDKSWLATPLITTPYMGVCCNMWVANK